MLAYNAPAWFGPLAPCSQLRINGVTSIDSDKITPPRKPKLTLGSVPREHLNEKQSGSNREHEAVGMTDTQLL